MEIKIPTSWDDITVGQYDELRLYNFNTVIISKLLSLVKSQTITNFLLVNIDDFNTLIKALGILLDVDEDILLKMELESLELILLKLDWINPLKDNKNYSIDFSKTDVGTFIDLEIIMEQGLDNNFIKFSDRLLNKESINLPITDVYSNIFGYLNFRNNLFKDFKGLFEESEDMEVIKDSSEIKTSNFNKKWNWYGLIYMLAEGDILKMDKVTDVNITAAFNYLSYQKEKTYLNN